jgi:lipoprotein signal peptidase
VPTELKRVIGRLPPLYRVALLVAAGDLLTKQAAVLLLGTADTEFSGWLRFTLVHNDAAALGLSFGAHNFAFNLVVKTCAILLMIFVSRDLARIDRNAPLALGLIVGAALGNLGSLLLHPAGVVDFIAVAVGSGQELVLNAADVAAYTGLAMLGRTVWRVIQAVRSPARAVLSEHLALRGVALRLVGERAVQRSVTPRADSPALEDELWVPKRKPHVPVTPLFVPERDERVPPREAPTARVIDLRTWRPSDSDPRTPTT